MQIFLPYDDFIKSAQALDDNRLNKQIIELTQIMSTVIWIQDCDKAETLYSHGQIYFPTHENHPIIKWVCKEAIPVFICVSYLYELIWEYFSRHCVFHKSSLYFLTFRFYFKTTGILGGPYMYLNNKFVENFTTNHKHIDDPFKAYRKELNLKWNNDIMKGNYPKWTNREKPEFFIREIKGDVYGYK